MLGKGLWKLISIFFELERIFMLSFEIKCVCGYEFRITVDQDRIQDTAIDKLVSMVDKTQKDHLECVKMARTSMGILSEKKET